MSFMLPPVPAVLSVFPCLHFSCVATAFTASLCHCFLVSSKRWRSCKGFACIPIHCMIAVDSFNLLPICSAANWSYDARARCVWPLYNSRQEKWKLNSRYILPERFILADSGQRGWIQKCGSPLQWLRKSSTPLQCLFYPRKIKRQLTLQGAPL